MRAIWWVMNFALLFFCFSGSSVSAEFSVIHTIVNYKTGVRITIKAANDNAGERLSFGGTLLSGSNRRNGSTFAGLGKGADLPEWIEIRWIETGAEWDMPSKDYHALSQIERDVRAKRYADLPIKSARVLIRSRIPESVIEEVKHAPLDPTRANLPLKSLRLYFVWTTDGVKLRWEVLQQCCKVLHEGGDPLPPASSASVGPS